MFIILSAASAVPLLISILYVYKQRKNSPPSANSDLKNAESPRGEDLARKRQSSADLSKNTYSKLLTKVSARDYSDARSNSLARAEKNKHAILFGLYLGALFFITVASRAFFESSSGFIFLHGDAARENYFTTRVNLEPFSTVKRMWRGWRGGYVNDAAFLYNIVGNIIMTSPAAYFWRKIFRRRGLAGFLLFFLAVVTGSLFIETAQLLSMTGSFDVDDVILNTLGGAAAYLFLALFERRREIK